MKEIQNDLHGFRKKVNEHGVSIKNLELHMTQLSTTMNPLQPVTLPSNTIQNPKNGGNYIAITTRGGEKTSDPPLPSRFETYNEKDIEVTRSVESVRL